MSVRQPNCCLCLVWLAACASAPPFAAPPVEVVVGYLPAAPAAEASAQTVDNVPQPDAKSMRLEVFALPVAPAFGSIEPQLVAVVAEGGAPFQAASSLPPGTRWANPAAAIDTGHRVGGAEAVLAPMLTTTFTLSDRRLPALGCELTPAGARLSLCSTAVDHPGTERAVLRQPLTAAAAGVLFVPAAGDGIAGHAIVLTLTGAVPAADLAAARAAAAAAAELPTVPAGATWQWRLAAGAIGAESRRAAMLAVAAQLDLPQCTDILLAADERHLIAIGAELTGLDTAAADYAWAFQRALWTGLVPGMQRDALPPGLRAAVIRQLGAVAAEPSTLQMHLLASRDAAAFAAALATENGYALADRDPVHRVRAHDWLTAHGEAVAAFDPLAPAAARTAALRAHAQAESAR